VELVRHLFGGFVRHSFRSGVHASTLFRSFAPLHEEKQILFFQMKKKKEKL